MRKNSATPHFSPPPSAPAVGQCLPAPSFCRLASPPRSFGEGPGVGVGVEPTLKLAKFNLSYLCLIRGSKMGYIKSMSRVEVATAMMEMVMVPISRL